VKKLQQGFTLIELMIVVAIIGILAAVAIPQYQDYVARSKLAAMVGSVASLQLAMSDGFQTNGTFPTLADLTAAGITIKSPKDATVTVSGGAVGVITIALTAALGSGSAVGDTIVFTSTPAVGGGDTTLRWVATTSVANAALKDYVLNKLSGV